jgi:hypothetical protein
MKMRLRSMRWGENHVGHVWKKVATGWRSAGPGKVTIDSGAEESVWPQGLLREEKTVMTGRVRKFVAANGTPMLHHGEKVVKFKQGDKGEMASMTFQVSDVTKPLASVARIVERGNIVQFGTDKEECFIKNKKTGRKIPIDRERGSFVLNVEYLLKNEEDQLFVRQGR